MREDMEKVRAGIDKELYINKYNPDEHEPHLHITDPAVCLRCAEKPCTVFCPAGVYVWEQEKITVQYIGCLECGSCRFGCPYGNIEMAYPRGGFGLIIKMG